MLKEAIDMGFRDELRKLKNEMKKVVDSMDMGEEEKKELSGIYSEAKDLLNDVTNKMEKVWFDTEAPEAPVNSEETETKNTDEAVDEVVEEVTDEEAEEEVKEDAVFEEVIGGFESAVEEVVKAVEEAADEVGKAFEEFEDSVAEDVEEVTDKEADEKNESEEIDEGSESKEADSEDKYDNLKSISNEIEKFLSDIKRELKKTLCEDKVFNDKTIEETLFGKKIFSGDSEGDKIFDKSVCLSNIRSLMKKLDIKIGQIEKQAGVCLGYMSRLERPDNVSEPSIQFITTAAKMLGVSLDDLVFTKMEETSKDEKYIIDFLRDLIDDSAKRNMIWSKESDFIIDSLFVTDDKVYMDGPAYSAKLPNSENKVYILNCFTKEDARFGVEKRFYEIYIASDYSEINPVCCTLKMGSVGKSVVNILFKSVVNNANAIVVESPVRNIIDAYRKNKENIDE